MLSTFRSQAIDLHYKSIDWFLCNEIIDLKWVTFEKNANVESVS